MLRLTRAQRRLSTTGRETESTNTVNNALSFGLCFLLATALLIAGCIVSRAAHAYTDEEAVLAIIGEAEDQGALGMTAVAKSILNRGNLKGVFGLTAPRVVKHKYSEKTLVLAEQAWKYAKANHPDKKWTATGWGNKGDIEQFKRQGWFKNCVITAHISDHYFYKEVEHGK